MKQIKKTLWKKHAYQQAKANELTQPRRFPLVGVEDQLADRIGFDEGSGTMATGRLAGGTSIVFSNMPAGLWQQENAPFDGDADTLPDWWEERYYGGPTNALPNADTDQDHATSSDEMQARTNPTNAASVLMFDSIAPANDASFIWQSIGGRRYRVAYRNDPFSNFIPLPRTQDEATEADVGLDLPSTETYVDDGSLIGGTTNVTSVYRIQLAE